MSFIPLAALAQTAATPDFNLAFARGYEFGQRDEFRAVLNLYLLIVLGGQLLGIIWTWLTSKLVVGGERATLVNALKWCLSGVLINGVFLFCIFFFAPAIIAQSGIAGYLAFFGGIALLSLVIIFVITMKIYEIGFFHSLGLMIAVFIFAGILNGGLATVTMKVFGQSRIEALANVAGQTTAERQSFMQRLMGQDAPDEIDRLLDDAGYPIGRPKPLAEREAAILVIQKKLEARRAALPPGKPEAAAELKRQLDRYLVILAKVKADRAAAVELGKS
jgi:hypothetical protein